MTLLSSKKLSKGEREKYFAKGYDGKKNMKF